MSDENVLLRLKDAWRECERNVYHLCRAQVLLEPSLPMTGEIFKNLKEDQVQTLDQFILGWNRYYKVGEVK